MSVHAATAPSGLPPFYRRRRFWQAAGPALATGLAILIGLGVYNVFYGSGGLHYNPIPLQPDPPTPKTVKLAPKALNDIHGLIRQFVETAVARKNLSVSYRLVDAYLREEISLKQWKTGAIPVVPYPVDAKTTISFERPEWTYAKSVRLQAHVVTPDKPELTKLTATDTFWVDVVKRGDGWLVDNWVPRWSPPIPNGMG